MTLRPATARRLWHLFEPIHALVYFAREKRARYEAAGLKGGWMAYFASRSAAMGAVSSEVVVAAFYNFQPDMVRGAIPDAWSYSSPQAVLEARLDIVDAALRRMLGDEIGSAEVQRAGDLLRTAVETCRPEGRPLFAAHSAVPWPAEPHLVLWNASTLLREFRGDGHVAALLTHRLDGCEANVLITGAGMMPSETQRSFRGWSEQEWQTAMARLRERGILDESGALTPGGRDLRARIEDLTDVLALPSFENLTEAELVELEDALERIEELLSSAGAVEYPNPMGLPRPGTPATARS